MHPRFPNMQRPRLSVLSGFVVGCGVLAFLSGCQSSTQRPAEEDRLSKLAVFYGRFISQNKGKTPANEKALKDFIQKSDTTVNLDELFVSPRDHEPYVVFYGTGQSAPGALAVTAHEKVGVNGKKMVSLATGQVKTVDDAELKQMLAESK